MFAPHAKDGQAAPEVAKAILLLRRHDHAEPARSHGPEPMSTNRAIGRCYRRRAMSNGADWIVFDPEILGGKPVIRGTRLSAQRILGLLATGSTREELLSAYPGPLSRGDLGSPGVCRRRDR